MTKYEPVNEWHIANILNSVEFRHAVGEYKYKTNHKHGMGRGTHVYYTEYDKKEEFSPNKVWFVVYIGIAHRYFICDTFTTEEGKKIFKTINFTIWKPDYSKLDNLLRDFKYNFG